MGLLDFLFGRNKNKTAQTADNHRKAIPERKINTIRISEITSGNINELQHSFIAFDTETTGLNSDSDVIIELGAVKFVDGNIAGSYGTLVNEGREVPEEASRVNHITTKMLKKEGKGPDIAYRELLSFIGDALQGHTVICAHNAPFDIAFLTNALERLGYSGTIKFIDTLSLSRKMIKGLNNYKQDTVAEYFGLKNKEAHRAVTDAEICGMIFCNLLKYQTKINIDKEEKAKPTDEELEIYSIILNEMKKNGCDIRNIRAYRNSSKYCDIVDIYTLLKIKVLKKSSYLVIPAIYADPSMNCEPCTYSEGEENVRLLFDDPFELEKYGELFAKMHKGMRVNDNEKNQIKAEFFTKANLTNITENEIDSYIDSARHRQERKLQEREEARKKEEIKKEQEKQKAIREEEKKKKQIEKELKQKQKSDEQNKIKEMIENAPGFTKEDINNIARISKDQGKRAVIQMDDEGNVLNVYESITEASKTAAVSSKSIRETANGKQKHAAGCCWKYADEI